MKKNLLLTVLFLGFITSLNAQMVLVFDTSKSVGTTISLPLYDGVDVTVDWGDENTETFTTPGDKTHIYAAEGIYTVSITGTLGRFGNGLQHYSGFWNLIEVSSFGDLGITSLSGAFHSASNLTKIPGSIPNTVTDLSLLFFLNRDFNLDIGQWDVKNVTNMYGTFASATSFNQDIGDWDVSNVVNMRSMFSSASSFNQNIGGWDVGNVTDMSSMFGDAKSFNQDIGGWDVGNVTDMRVMFGSAKSFNQDIGGWDVSNVTDMYKMFSFATNFNQNIGGWNVGKTTTMHGAFQKAESFNQDIGQWDVGNVTDMAHMFNEASSFNQDIGEWNVGNVTDMNCMFRRATVFNQDIGDWNVSKVTNMYLMFYDAISFNQDIGRWDVGNVTNMSRLFHGAISFNGEIGNWNVGNANNMESMFQGATSFNKDIGGWDVSNVTHLDHLFAEAGLSPFNYDRLLIGWSKRTLKNNLVLNAGNSQYTGAATDARQSIISTFNWTITDGGLSDTHTDVGEISESGLLVYPNPFTDHIKVSHTLEVSGLVLLNMAGQVVAVSRGNTEILTGQLPDGIYLLRIEFANNPPQVVRILKK